MSFVNSLRCSKNTETIALSLASVFSVPQFALLRKNLTCHLQMVLFAPLFTFGWFSLLHLLAPAKISNRFLQSLRVIILSLRAVTNRNASGEKLSGLKVSNK